MKNTAQTQQILSSELEWILSVMAVSSDLPWKNPDAAAAAVTDRSGRLVAEGWLAYLRGDFEKTIENYRAIESEALRLYFCFLAMAAAVSVGDWKFLRELESWCEKLSATAQDASVAFVADLALTDMRTCSFIPAQIPDWLKNGDFSALPPSLKREAFYRYARWLLVAKKYEAALAVSRTGLSLNEHGVSNTGVHLRVFAAISCLQLGDADTARKYLENVMADCMPLGFITPLVEHGPHLGGLLERIVEQKYPDQLDAVTRQTKRTIPNWMTLHNRLAKGSLASHLTPREYQIAKDAAAGVSRKEIAERFHLSQGTVKNIMSGIYQTLHITGKNRDEKLARHVL